MAKKSAKMAGARGGKKKRGGRLGALPVAALIVVAVAALCWTAVAFDNGRISTVTYSISIPGLPQALEGYTIVQLSDLNGAEVGDGQKKLCDAVNNIRYDAICMTGDMIGASGDARPLITLIDALDTKKPIIYISGDSDPSPLKDAADDSGSLYADYMLALQDRGVKYLDSPYLVEVGSAKIWFSSSLHLNVNAQEMLTAAQSAYDAAMRDSALDPGALVRAAYKLNCAQQLVAAAKGMDAADVHITLSHVPLSDGFVKSLQYAESDLAAASPIEQENNRQLRMIDVALCGHYVGGQWRLPLYGALYVPDERLERGGWMPQQEYVTGMRRVNSASVVISAGLGASDAYNLPRFRLFNTPQIVVLKLTAQLGA